MEYNQQITHWLINYVELANKFNEEGNKELTEYWKGQVFGTVKTAELILGKENVDYSWYLKQLP